jgi:hypothetical protein
MSQDKSWNLISNHFRRLVSAFPSPSSLSLLLSFQPSRIPCQTSPAPEKTKQASVSLVPRQLEYSGRPRPAPGPTVVDDSHSHIRTTNCPSQLGAYYEAEGKEGLSLSSCPFTPLEHPLALMVSVAIEVRKTCHKDRDWLVSPSPHPTGHRLAAILASNCRTYSAGPVILQHSA